MGNEIEKMLSSYGLADAKSIFSVLDMLTEEEARKYCWQVLNSYPDLKKESWTAGLEGGDYIYSFEDKYVFITDDIWSFNLMAKPEVLEILAEKVRALKS